MVGYMSRKSKIYHRSGCRYVKKIAEQSLISFNFDDGRPKEQKPCKCCCNLKKIYDNYKPSLKTVFENFNITTEFDGEYIRVHTDWYNWRIWLKPSSQFMKLYLEQWDEENQKTVLVKCKMLKKTNKISTVMQYIAYEERVAVYPAHYRNQALQIEQYAKENGVEIEFDGTNLYILTDIAAWKIVYGYHSNWYKLLHCPFNGRPLTMEKAKAGHYHVQTDVPKDQSPYKHLQYIVEHDIAKKIEMIDYKKLPQRTKMQKKYYRQAENRARKNSIARVFDIFAELEAKSEMARVSFG